MKTKNLFIMLIIIGGFLAYNLFCSALLNNNIKRNTSNIIKTYLKNKENTSNYEYITATNNSDNTINVYIKLPKENKYYRFILTSNNSSYSLVEVNNNIPVYIR